MTPAIRRGAALTKGLGLLLALGIAGAGVFYFATRQRPEGSRFRKARIERGDVVATVTASGTLAAVTTVKVGSQVSGIIARLHADFNQPVKKGMLLAELDPTPFQAIADQRRADLERSRVELRNAELAMARAKSLAQQRLLAQAELDAAETNRDAARAAVQQGEAALRQALTNLAYTKIASPIDGIVVDRQMDVGQTIAASFQAPTLFTIAQDLTKMQVLTNIDEADIGRITIGQRASFTVDAFPDTPFTGSVSQVRLSPQTVQNVVTYPVLIDVANPNGRLRPGMTANVQVPVETREGTLRVPNAALRFRPEAVDVLTSKAVASADSKPAKPEQPDAAGPNGQEGTREDPRGTGSRAEGKRGPREGARAGATRSGRPSGGRRQAVLYAEIAGGKLRAIPVTTGITDGTVTAIESSELKEGDEIVAGLVTARASDSSSRPGAGAGSPQRRPF